MGTEAPDRTETEFVDTSAMDIDLVNGSEIFNQSFERDPFGRLILPSRVTPMSPTSDSGQISPLPERISSPSPVSSPVAQRSVSRPPLQVTRALTPVTRTDLSPVSRVPVSQSRLAGQCLQTKYCVTGPISRAEFSSPAIETIILSPFNKHSEKLRWTW